MEGPSFSRFVEIALFLFFLKAKHGTIKHKHMEASEHFIIGGLKVKVQDIDRTQQVTQKLTGLKL